MHTVDFLGIGVQKGGTTWLYRQLSRHPQVAFPAGKETHFWDRGGSAGSDTWVRMLQPASRLSPDGRPVRTGEITPAYAILADRSIRAIHACCPELRLFIALRNPIERAWSAALMGLARCGMQVEEASDAWFLDFFRAASARRRGDYAGCLERWWSVFPRERLLVILNEDIAGRPAAVLASLAAHLGIDASDFASLPDEVLAKVITPSIGVRESSPAPPLRPSLFAPLLELHADDIARVERALDRDFASWREPRNARSPAGARVSVRHDASP
jgi:hypothetical protein